ncbi:fimbrial protein [Burkholderia cepacia]|uniref:fimbrial protein n=1 Tax=Burkholderia cepacia TaxID=292 RepID=UPI001295FC9B|nr:fimbrial protein [Burkholderia cepacia]QFS37616.1 Fimbrial protein [Burkholderia cepacia]
MLMVFLSTPAFSASSCGMPVQSTIHPKFPQTLSVPRDAAIGSVLATFSIKELLIWYCEFKSRETVGVFHQLGPLFAMPTGKTYAGLQVYETGVPGVGIAIRAQMVDHYHNHGRWYGLQIGRWVGQERDWNNNLYKPHAYGAIVEITLVKTGPIIGGGTIPAGVFMNSAPSTDKSLQRGQMVSYIIDAPIIIVASTCTTPDIDVAMGSFKTTDFPRTGSLSPGAGASVPIRLLNCPALGAGHTIQYRVDPTSGTVERNVAALTGGDSSAKGLGIQLFDAYGKVFPLSQNQRLNDYNSNSGGNYTVPLTARYYATGKVTAGPANSTMTLTVLYQ